MGVTRVVAKARKDEVLALVAQSGDSVSLAEIGRGVGLSREAVRQIVRKSGSHARRRRKQPELICAQCGKVFPAWPCEVKLGRRFCSRECSAASRRGARAPVLAFRCEFCGEIYTRKASEAKRGTRFCRNVCQGKWLSSKLSRERGRFKRIEKVKSA